MAWEERIEELELELGHDKDDMREEEIQAKINEYLTLAKVDRRILVNLIDKIFISEDKTVEIHYKFKLY